MNREEAIEVLSQDLPCEHDTDLIEALKIAISALEQEPSGITVSRQAVLDLAKFDSRDGLGSIIHAFDVERLPSAEKTELEPSYDRVNSDLISRWDLLDAFDLSDNTRKYGGDGRSGYRTLMLYEIQDIIEEMPSYSEMPNKWIPVSERLPQINEWVLCQCRAGYKVLRLTSYGCYCNDTQEYMDSFVIAWMPLPQPYKDGGE